MSTRIDLHFSKTLDIDLLERGMNIWLVRIVGQVRFKAGDSWSRAYEAIIDTGAPVSLIPLAIWKHVDSQPICDYRISGIVPGKRCSLSVKVGTITCRIIGKDSSSKDMKMNAYFASTDRIPLIIGFDSLLTNLKLVSDYNSKTAYFEQK